MTYQEVLDDAPGVVQAVLDARERVDQALPGGPHAGLQRVQRRLCLGQHLAHARFHMPRVDRVEQREVRPLHARARGRHLSKRYERESPIDSICAAAARVSCKTHRQERVAAGLPGRSHLRPRQHAAASGGRPLRVACKAASAREH